MVRKQLRAVHAPELKPQMRTPPRPANFRGFWPFSQDFFEFLTPCGSYLRVWGKGGVWTRLYINLECILGQIWELGPWSLSSSSSQNKPLDYFCKKWEKCNFQCILSGSGKIFLIFSSFHRFTLHRPSWASFNVIFHAENEKKYLESMNSYFGL